jgi:riboflavin kinase / FMN adenylyltransferase
VWLTYSLTTLLTPTTVALGNFDGVHRGHQSVIGPILPDGSAPERQPLLIGQSVHDLDAALSRNLELQGGTADSIDSPIISRPHATVLTFHPHPQEFFTGQSRLLLTPPEQKAERLQKLGVEQLVLLPFDQSIAMLSPEDFVDVILVQQLQATKVSVGENFRFGQGRVGTAETLRSLAAQHGIETTIVSLQTSETERISSSTIRQALQDGDLQKANRLLGYSYPVVGTVIRGQRLGRTLGFPTANLQISPLKFLPHWGVYAVRVTSPTLELPGGELLGVMNLGIRPTIEGTQPVLEVHILQGWTGDLYGHTLVVSLEHFLRAEQKFDSLEALKTQIRADCVAAEILLNP